MNILFEMNMYLLVFLMSSFNWLMTVLGASLVFLVKKESQKLISIALGIAAGIMIAASFFSLLLPAIEQLESRISLCIVPIGFLTGGMFLRLCDKYLPHEHVISHELEGVKSPLPKNKLLFLAMTLHNIPEGMAVGIAFAGAGNHLLPAMILSIGIGIQNFPEGAIVSMPLKSEGASKGKAFLYGTLSGIVEPIAAIITIVLTNAIVPVLPYILAFAAGAMIYVVVEELIPESQAGDHSNIGTVGVAIGFVIMMILDVALG